jgi:hypothetical protein
MLQNEKIERLVNDIKEYINLRYELIKLEMTERTSMIGASLISLLLVVISILFFLFFVSVGLSFYLSELIGDKYSGFLIVAAAYLVLGLLFFFGRKKLIEEPFRNKIIRKLLNKKE